MSVNIKEEAARLVENLASDATCDEICVRQAIDSGLSDSDADEVVPVEDVRRDFGL